MYIWMNVNVIVKEKKLNALKIVQSLKNVLSLCLY